jgi:hypothetical protein
MRISLLPLLLTIAISTPIAYAHHSFAMFDPNKKVELEGTVKIFKWSSPHGLIEVTVPYKSGPVDWSIEMGNVGGLMRGGWKPDTIKPGDKVKFVVHPLRNGNAGGSFISMTLPDGKVMSGGGNGNIGGAGAGGGDGGNYQP